MIKKRVSLFGNALRSISEGSTSSATFMTAVPTNIRSGGHGQEEADAKGIKMLLGVTSRTSNNGTALSLNVFLEQRDSQGVWRGLVGTTMTPVITATVFETLEIYPGVDVTTVPLRRSFLIPSPLRAVAKLQGSITATPSMTFFLDAELYS